MIINTILRYDNKLKTICERRNQQVSPQHADYQRVLQEWHFFCTQLNSFEFKGSPALRNLYKTEEKMLFAPISSGFVFIFSP